MGPPGENSIWALSLVSKSLLRRGIGHSGRYRNPQTTSFPSSRLLIDRMGELLEFPCPLKLKSHSGMLSGAISFAQASGSSTLAGDGL